MYLVRCPRLLNWMHSLRYCVHLYNVLASTQLISAVFIFAEVRRVHANLVHLLENAASTPTCISLVVSKPAGSGHVMYSSDDCHFTSEPT
jgi:hypothetical protein